ncbi:ribosome-associated protein [Propionispira arboris]|jgi:ribosome-associated protein|uniref:Ribosome-associated protein n=1 Tax=Propionispira arboris TaxID=84035 RepID=A0A1H7BEW8_9FIRM|nr:MULTISPECIES: RNA-binding S4 domain-containing protein [Propionispira]SEJ73102.1 ribosome-associated protein [Propionispira arboris]
MENIEIKTDVIQMDQLLKWAGIIESGGQMKFMIEDQVIKLNQVLVTEKRKKVFPGDILEINGVGTWKVVKVQGE